MKKIKISRQKLVKLYIEKELSTYSIAKLIKCDPTVIQKRLKEYDIPSRQPKKKIDLDKEKLENLYLENNLSTYKIAKFLNVKSNNTISRKLRDAGIRARQIIKTPITKEDLDYLYHVKKWPFSKIAHKFSCTPTIIFRRMKEFGIDVRTVSEANTIYAKNDFSGNLIEKAYLIGFRLGDLNVRQPGSLIQVKSSTTKQEQVELFKKLFQRYGHVRVSKSNLCYNHQVGLNKSFEFLTPKKDNIEEWILESDDFFVAFLAGYVDAEGNIGVYSKQARFKIKTYDKFILRLIYQKLNQMQINAKFSLDSPMKKGKHNKDLWCVSVNKKQSLYQLFNILKPHIKHAKRFKDLTIAESNVQERLKP
ncbi:hypothetical protein ISS07_02095 [Candidatus Woesearchaeota archaeon]|nr:hypothetical protein [Candidatus Woesearchaeota archaeon]